MNDLINQQTQDTTPTIQSSAQIDFVLLDASGSMYDKWRESTEAIDNYVNELRYSEVNTQVTMATFTTYGSSLAFTIVRDTKPETWQRVAYDESITTSGSTPLYDAINAMMTHLRDKNPAKCSILIVTDGEENGSKTTVEQAQALLNWGRRRGWQITFFGCDFENSRQAKMLGVNDSNAIGLDKKRLADATSALAKKRQYYSEFGTKMDFSEQEKKDLGGLLPPPK
jgi:hypothetical protein